MYNHFQKDIYSQLYDSNINFENKFVLDIGSRDGINCVSMAKLGTKKIIGIDIDDSQFYKIDEIKKNYNIQLIKSNIFDYTSTDKFDIITCFLWNINLSDYDKIIIKVKSLIKPNGLILIGIYDHLYKYGYENLPNTGSVIELIRKTFNIWSILNINGLQWILKIIAN